MGDLMSQAPEVTIRILREKLLDALRREKAARDELAAAKAAHAAEVAKLKAEIDALDKALGEECE